MFYSKNRAFGFSYNFLGIGTLSTSLLLSVPFVPITTRSIFSCSMHSITFSCGLPTRMTRLILSSSSSVRSCNTKLLFNASCASFKATSTKVLLASLSSLERPPPVLIAFDFEISATCKKTSSAFAFFAINKAT